MISVLAFNAVKAFKTTGVNLLKQVGIEKVFMTFWKEIKNIGGNSRCWLNSTGLDLKGIDMASPSDFICHYYTITYCLYIIY